MELVHMDVVITNTILPNEMAYLSCSQYYVLLKVNSGQNEQPGNCKSDKKYFTD